MAAYPYAARAPLIFRGALNSRLQQDETSKDKLIEEFSLEPVSMDIEAAVAVIRQRNTENDTLPDEPGYFLDLSNAYLFNADFSNTKLTRVNFSDSVVMNCIFDNTNLSKSNFKASNLKGSSFLKCDLRGAELRGAKLTQEQVNSMRDSDNATLPEGLH